MRRMDVTEVLNSWEGLNETIMKLGEPECHSLLNAERTGRRRVGFLLRIHSRINKLRADRERTELRRVAR